MKGCDGRIVKTNNIHMKGCDGRIVKTNNIHMKGCDGHMKVCWTENK